MALERRRESPAQSTKISIVTANPRPLFHEYLCRKGSRELWRRYTLESNVRGAEKVAVGVKSHCKEGAMP